MNSSYDSRAATAVDSSQILVEVQLKLIYYLETVLSFVRARTAAALSDLGKTFHVYLADSALYNVVFKWKTYFLNNTVRRRRLLEWLHDKLRPPFTPTNFTTDWADGVRLCALCEVISPGACPRYDLLSPANAQSNIKLALGLVQAYLNVKPSITVREIYECSSEANLVHLLSQIKISYAKKVIKSTGASWLKLPNGSVAPGHLPPPFAAAAPFSEFYFSRCFVKGMGLVSGVRSRRSRFSLYYYEPLPKISLIFEIVGPSGSFCSEKVVAEFEPGMGNSGEDDELSLSYDGADELHREMKQLEQMEQRSEEEYRQAVVTRAAMQKRAIAGVNTRIPFFYKVYPDHILITYIPLFTGDHIISIIWQGQHVLNSPYTVSIEESEYLEGEVRDIKPAFELGQQYPLCLLPEQAHRSLDEMGTVVRKKVLKRSIIAGGKEYDYDDYFEKNYSPHFLKYPSDSRILDPKITDDSFSSASFAADETDAAALSKLINRSNVAAAAAAASSSSSLSSASHPQSYADQADQVNASSRTRKDSVDSGISQETVGGSSRQSQQQQQQQPETVVKQQQQEHPKSTKEKRTVTKTTTKISFSESKVRITEKVRRRSSAQAEEGTAVAPSSIKTVPEIKVTSPRGEEVGEDQLLTAPPTSPSDVRTPSLKEMMSENGKQFQEHMDKMRKKLEDDLHRYKSQLESSL